MEMDDNLRERMQAMAAADQFSAGAKAPAQVLAALYHAFRAEGVVGSHAARMAVDYVLGLQRIAAELERKAP